MTNKQPRGFWCEFNEQGQCLDLIEGSRDKSPGHEYVWIQEASGGCLEKAIYAVTVMEKAMRQLQLDHPDTPVTWPRDDGTTTYRTIEDWVCFVFDRARGGQ